jgi:hypothetical protein
MILVCWAAAGCGMNEVPIEKPASSPLPEASPGVPTATAAGSSAGADWGSVLHAKIKVKDGAGKDVFSIKPEDDGAKLVDASDQEIARFNLKDEKLKIKDASDHVLGYVVGSGGKYHLKDSDQKSVLFELQRQDDGDWKLKDGRENSVYRIKRREYGFEIQDAQEVSLAKVKTKGGKLELRDASDRIRYATSATAIGPLCLACLGLDRVGDLPLKAGLMIRIALDEAASPTPHGDAKR